MEDIYSAIKLTIGKLLAKTEEFENQLNFGKSLEFYQRLVTRVADAIQLLEASCSSSPAVHNHLNHHPQKAKIDWLKSIHEAAIAEMEELELRINHFQEGFTFQEDGTATLAGGAFSLSASVLGQAILSDHHLEGIEWLFKIHRTNLPGCILSDEAGMGKNVQVVAFLQGLFHVGAIHRVLICCQDLGALPVWKQTVNSLFPEIKHIKLFDQTSSVERSTKKLASLSEKGGIGLISYNCLLHLYARDGLDVGNTSTNSSGGGWDYLILDHGSSSSPLSEIYLQSNPSTTSTTTMKSCISSSFNSATKHRILLTDVPIHNDLSLLYSLFDFATCSTTSVFGTLDNFNLKFATPILAALRQDANEEDIHLAQEAADELREWSCKYYLRREQVYDEDDVDDVLEVVEEKNKVQEKDEEELMVLTDDEKVDKMEDTYMDTSVFHLDNPQTKNMAHHLSFAPVNSSGVEEVTEKMTRQFSIMAEEVQGEVDQTPPPAKNNCRAAHGCPSGKHMSRAVEIRNCRCTLQESQMDQYSDLLLEFRKYMNKRQYSDALQQIKLALAVCDDDQRVHWWKFKLVHQMHSHPQQHVL